MAIKFVSAMSATLISAASMATVLYDENFDVNILGALSGQSTSSQSTTWTVSSGTNWEVVDTIALSGNQSVKAASTGASYYAWPASIPGLYSITPGSIWKGSVDIWIDPSSTNISTFGMTVFAGATRIAGIRHTWTNSETIIGTAWAQRSDADNSGWNNLAIEVTYDTASSGTCKYFLNGTQLGPTQTINAALTEFNMYSFNGTVRIAYFDNFKVEQVLSEVPISGQVNLQSFGGSLSAESVSIELLDSNGAVVESHPNVPLDFLGNYTVNTSLQGVYAVRAKGRTWLAQAINSVSIGSSGSSNVNFSLVNGDVDGDNEVAPNDFSILSGAFGNSNGDPGYSVNADLDGDGEVGPSDFSILSTNFGESGD